MPIYKTVDKNRCSCEKKVVVSMGDNDFCCNFSRSVHFCQGVTGVDLKLNHAIQCVYHIEREWLSICFCTRSHWLPLNSYWIPWLVNNKSPPLLEIYHAWPMTQNKIVKYKHEYQHWITGIFLCHFGNYYHTRKNALTKRALPFAQGLLHSLPTLLVLACMGKMY